MPTRTRRPSVEDLPATEKQVRSRSPEARLDAFPLSELGPSGFWVPTVSETHPTEGA